MGIEDTVLSNAMQFASVTAKIVDELLELLNSLAVTRAESRELREFLKAEKEYLATGNEQARDGRFTCFNSAELDAKALHEKFKSEGLKCYVIYDKTNNENGNLTTGGRFIFRNEDVNKAKQCLLSYAREIVGCVHLPPSELCKKLKNGESLYKVENVSYGDMLAIQSIAKKSGRQFCFTSEERMDSDGFNVYCLPKDIGKLNLALAEISVNHSFYGNKTVAMGVDISAKNDIIKNFIEKVQNGEDVRMYNGDNSTMEIRASNGEFSIYENGRAIFKPKINLLEDKQQYYTELHSYLKNFNHPVFLTKEEYESENIEEIRTNRITEKYPSVEELPDSHQKAIIAFNKLAIGTPSKTEFTYDNFINFFDNYSYVVGENEAERKELLDTVKHTVEKNSWSYDFVSKNSEEFAALQADDNFDPSKVDSEQIVHVAEIAHSEPDMENDLGV